MINRVQRAGVLAVALLALPAMLPAQARPATARPAAASPAEVRGWTSELRLIGERLQAAHTRAMQDPELRAAGEALARDIKTAMERADPELDRLATRARGMQEEMRAAEQRGDRTRLTTLMRELDGIQERFVRAQEAAMRSGDLLERNRRYEARLRARLVQIEPETDRLLERSRDLQSRIQRAMSAQQGTGPRRTP